MSKQKTQLAQSLAKEDPKGSLTGKLSQSAKQGAVQDEIQSLNANIKARQEEIAELYLLSPVPNPGTLALISVKLKDIAASKKRIAELQGRRG